MDACRGMSCSELRIRNQGTGSIDDGAGERGVRRLLCKRCIQPQKDTKNDQVLFVPFGGEAIF